MPIKDWPARARRLYHALYEDGDSDAIRGLPLKPGISEAFFAELVVGCLYRNQERAEAWEARDRKMHAGLASEETIERIKGAGRDWPFELAARQALQVQDKRRREHDEAARMAKAYGRFFDPVVCLNTLFRHLVRPSRGQGIEWYVENYLPRILTVAGIKPRRARAWTRANLEKHLQRNGRAGAVAAVAYYLLSTDERLKPFRPSRPPSLGLEPAPQYAGIMDLAIGRALFRLPDARKAPPAKHSQAGQRTRKSG
jgi:hypothetical protein